LGQQNIGLWNERYGEQMPGWGSAVIVQGDSRRLGEVLGRARLCLSSPPYTNSMTTKETKNHPGGTNVTTRYQRSYGNNPRNLGNLPDGGFEVAISSPPYANSMSSEKSGIDWSQCHREDGTLRDMSREPAHTHRPGAGGEMRYSDDPTNLGNLPDTGFEAALAISSPAWMGSGVGGRSNVVNANKQCVSHNRPESIGRGETARGLTYGSEPGQLAQMPEGDLVLAISSPPFLAQSGGTNVTAQSGPLADASLLKRHSAGNQAAEGYGISDGQLAALPEGNHAEACEGPVCCVSSPPFLGSLNDGLRESDREKYAEFARAGRGVELITAARRASWDKCPLATMLKRWRREQRRGGHSAVSLVHRGKPALPARMKTF